MGAQFCMKCGQPLPPGAGFCQSCGTPVPSATPSPGLAAPAAPGAPPSGMNLPPAPAGPPLSAVLGIQGVQNFLLQHQLMGAGHSYRVLDHQKRHLFTAKENFGGEYQAALANQQASGGGFLGFAMMQNQPRNRAFVWSVHDASGNPRGTITVQMQGNTAVSTLTDAAGAPQFAISINRGFTSMTANAAYPDGRPMLEAKGHLISHNFSIHAPDGPEVAKVHEAWASVRDTYNLDVAGRIDPLAPIIFAIMIDREKEASKN